MVYTGMTKEEEELFSQRQAEAEVLIKQSFTTIKVLFNSLNFWPSNSYKPNHKYYQSIKAIERLEYILETNDFNLQKLFEVSDSPQKEPYRIRGLDPYRDEEYVTKDIHGSMRTRNINWSMEQFLDALNKEIEGLDL